MLGVDEEIKNKRSLITTNRECLQIAQLPFSSETP